MIFIEAFRCIEKLFLVSKMFLSGDARLFSAAVLFQYLASALAFFSIQLVNVPYGRYARPGSGPVLPPALAWFLMESPAVWLTLLLFPHGRHSSHPLALAIISLFLLHYAHRTFVYPLRLLSAKNPKGGGYPLRIAAVGFSVNLLNAYIQTRSVSHYADYNASRIWISLRVVFGLGLFLWGMAVNIRSDLELVRLKKEGGGGYQIPRGGWFEVVACPNYMGEAAEWLGWAVMAWSPAALGFFLSTCSNLGPRARSYLVWYRQKFGDEYPASRKAFIPYVY